MKTAQERAIAIVENHVREEDYGNSFPDVVVGVGELTSAIACAIEEAVADAVRLKDLADAPVSAERLQEWQKDLDGDPCDASDAIQKLLDHIRWQAGFIRALLEEPEGQAWRNGYEAGKRAEREQCAIIAEEAEPGGSFRHQYLAHGMAIAKYIRAREQPAPHPEPDPATRAGV